MFFDRENCHAIRILEDVSGFLEASINKLLELEKETLEEIEREKKKSKEGPVCIKQESNVSQSKPSYVPGNSSQINGLESNSVMPPLEPSIPNQLMDIDLSRFSSPSTSQNNSGNNSHKRKLDDRDVQNPCVSDEKIKKVDTILQRQVKKEMQHLDPEVFASSVFSSKTAALVLESMTSKANNSKSDCLEKVEFGNDVTIMSHEDIKKQNCTSALVQTEVEHDTSIPDSKKIEAPEENNFKAVIRFKKCFTHNYATRLLNRVGIHNFQELVLNKQKAVVSFSSENKLKELLSMNNKRDLNKLEAYHVGARKPFVLKTNK